MNLSFAGPEEHHILVVEDDDAHAFIIESCLRRIEIPQMRITLTRVRDGESVLDCLHRRGDRFAHLPMPSLILLDLKLPGMDGRELLRALKSNPEWWLIPIVVLTTSNSGSDRMRVWELQASGYIVKPMAITNFRKMLDSALRYWLRWNRLPQLEGPPRRNTPADRHREAAGTMVSEPTAPSAPAAGGPRPGAGGHESDVVSQSNN